MNYNQNYRDIAAAHSRMSQRQNYRAVAARHDRVGNYGYGYGYPSVGQATDQGGAGMMQGPPAGSMSEYQAWLEAGCPAPGCCETPKGKVSRPAIVGMPNECIDPCETETIETSVCADFTLTGLFVPSKIASCLALKRFKLGCWDLLVSCDEVSMEIFSCCELLIGNPFFAARTVTANAPICMDVVNKCKAQIEFEATLVGTICDVC